MTLAITTNRHASRLINRGMILLLANGPGTDAAFVLLATADGAKSKRRICGPIYSPSLDISVGFALNDTDSAASQRPLAGSERGGDRRHSVHSTGAYQI